MRRTVGGRPELLLAAAVVLLTACGSPAATSTGGSRPRATSPPATETPATPTAVVTGPAAPPAPAGPLAVVYTDTDHSSSSYRVLLIGLDGTIVASSSAQLPASQPNQTLTLSPVSVAGRLAYYRDGSTDIRALAPDGTTALATSIPGAGTAEMAFAVSPDAARIALALITEAQDPSQTSVHAVMEDLAGGGNRSTLYDASGSDAYRWPVAWLGSDIVLGVGATCGNGGLYNAQGIPQPMPCVSSLRSVAQDSGSPVARICEVPSPEPYGQSDVRTLEGLPVAAGVACYAYTSHYQQGTSTCSLDAVSLSGGAARFDGCSSGAGYLAEDSCFLAPDGSSMACLTSSSTQVAILTPGGHLRTLGRKATILGWMDSTHLLIDVDAGHLAVLDTGTGAATTIAVDGAAHAAMAGVVTG